MRWIKLHGNMFSDDRLQLLLKEQRFAGIGLYLFMLQLVECQGEGVMPYNQLAGAIDGKSSRKKLLELISDYDLFLRSEEGLVLSVDPIPGYTSEEMVELRRSDAIDAVSRAHVSVRSCVPACPCAHDTRAGEKEKIRKEKSRGNTHFQKPSVEEVAAYCAERGNGIEAQHFLDFYEARGWKYGHTRTHRPHEQCLSVDTDKGLYPCYHCGQSGYVPTQGEQEARAKQKKRREEPPRKRGAKGNYSLLKAFSPEFLIDRCLEAPDAQPLIRFLTEERNLNLDLLQRYRITLPYASFPSEEAPMVEGKKSYVQVRTIAFHFFDLGEYINVKHRTLDKRFTLHPKGELIPWNIDALINKPICYITEGEIDAMTLIQCGYLETISVPNGAQKNLSFLDPYVKTHIEEKIRIVLALDNDERGIVLRNHQCCWINASGEPILQAFLDRFNARR